MMLRTPDLEDQIFGGPGNDNINLEAAKATLKAVMAMISSMVAQDMQHLRWAWQ